MILTWIKAYDLYCDAKRRLEGANETGNGNLIDAMTQAYDAAKATLDHWTNELNSK